VGRAPTSRPLKICATTSAIVAQKLKSQQVVKVKDSGGRVTRRTKGTPINGRLERKRAVVVLDNKDWAGGELERSVVASEPTCAGKEEKGSVVGLLQKRVSDTSCMFKM